jgi:hypothetical protein
MKARVRWMCCFVMLSCMAQMRTGPRGATDGETLRQLHEQVMRSHRQSDIEGLLEHDAKEYVLVDRGVISRPSLEERRARLGSYLGRTRFEVYRDVIEPIVSVSKDGTLGWVVAQVHARGMQRSTAGKEEPLEFDSAWIELYEKRGGRWYAVGNVSNFKP